MVSTRFVLVITVWSYQCLPYFLDDQQCQDQDPRQGEYFWPTAPENRFGTMRESL